MEESIRFDKTLILIIKKKYLYSLDRVISKLGGRDLLYAAVTVIAGVASAYQANLFGSTYGYGYSRIEYSVIPYDYVKSIKKYLKYKVKICANWTDLIEENFITLNAKKSSERFF